MSKVSDVYRRIEDSGRTEVFIHLRPQVDVEADFLAAQGPLAGLLLAVKDNVDVAGVPTTAACPGFSYLPDADAPAVTALKAAGAVVIGKTNLDQFATGLVGTRSPYGAVRDSRRPEYISGGSSSGSAVAVALGVCRHCDRHRHRGLGSGACRSARHRRDQAHRRRGQHRGRRAGLREL
jgi:Asp-tRNA(Asn)/Glu-tRNA(Gln) amidotransferase A subunit family amidase